MSANASTISGRTLVLEPGWQLRLQQEEQRRKSLAIGRGRMLVMSLFMTAIFLVLGGAVVWQAWNRTLAKSHIQALQKPARLGPMAVGPRGDIVDAKGIVLATTLRTASLFARPKYMLDLIRCRTALHGSAGMSAQKSVIS